MHGLIFLDFDGVLNSEKYFVDNFKQHSGIVVIDKKPIDKNAVALLNEIIEKTGAKVVVTSVWRSGHDVKGLQKLLSEFGFNGEVIGKTDHLQTYYNFMLRGNEILKWRQDNNKEKCPYVIIDDDSDMLLWQKDNFVETDNKVGLTKEKSWEAISILNRGNNG